VKAVSNYQLALRQTAPSNPPNNGDIGVGKLLEIIVPIPAPAIEPYVLVLLDGGVVRLTLSE
jgi:hypothetical protein